MTSRQNNDIIHGKIKTSVIHLTWPVLASQALYMLPIIYDAVWLGKLGSNAQAAAGLAMAVRMTLVSLMLALSTGSAAVVSRYVGAKEQQKADLAALQAIIMMVIVSGVLGIFGIVFARPLMQLAGADAATLPLAVRYTRILFAGLIAIEMVPSVGGMLNAAGAPRIYLGMTLSCAAVLVVSEPFLVRWLGLDGAALALVVSNAIGTLYGAVLIFSGRAPIRLDLRALSLDWPMMKRIIQIAIPAVVQRGAPNLALSLLTRMVSAFGAPTLAAWVIVRRIYDFSLIPSVGVIRTTPAMVGQNLGAFQPERASSSVRFIARVASLAAGLIITLLVVFAPSVLSLFSDDPETIRVGMESMSILSIGYLALVIGSVFDAAQSGAGDTLSPMIINVVSLWLFLIPLALFLSRSMDLGAPGIWVAVSSGWMLNAVMMHIRFRQGRWKVMQFS